MCFESDVTRKYLPWGVVRVANFVSLTWGRAPGERLPNIENIEHLRFSFGDREGEENLFSLCKYSIFLIKKPNIQYSLQFWANIQYSCTILSQYSIFIIPLQPPIRFFSFLLVKPIFFTNRLIASRPWFVFPLHTLSTPEFRPRTLRDFGRLYSWWITCHVLFSGQKS